MRTCGMSLCTTKPHGTRVDLYTEHARITFCQPQAAPLLLIKPTSSSTMAMPVYRVQGKVSIPLTQLSWWTSPNPTEQPLSLLVTRPRIILRAAAAATLSWRSARRPKGADRPRTLSDRKGRQAVSDFLKGRGTAREPQEFPSEHHKCAITLFH